MHQAIRYWAEHRKTDQTYVGVCSDAKVGHGEKTGIPLMEMGIGVTTDADKIAAELEKQKDKNKMTVVFTTYHSLKAVEEAQKTSNVTFDLVLCDEAHRTTGVEGEFTLVHKNERIRAHRRLYMTATPNVYRAAIKNKAEQLGKDLYSMEDGAHAYGPVLHRLSFSDAIDRSVLTDYQVIVLGISEKYGVKALQNLVDDVTDAGDVNLTDAARSESIKVPLP